MAEDAAEIIRTRNEFYRDNYRNVLMALVALVLINAGLIGIIYYQLTHRPIPQYFATSVDGKIVKLQPLSQPVIAPSVLLQWATQAAVAAQTYDFVNYQKELQEVQNTFTPRGWKDFENSLKQSRQLETVKAKHLVLSAVATGAPVVINQGIVDGAYSWTVQLPMLVAYQSASEVTQLPLVVTLLIKRVNLINNPEGIAIDSFVQQEGQATG